MPVLREFDTEDVRPWHKPTADTCATLTLPRPYAAPPRLPHGLRRLDISCNADIHVKSTLQDITKSRADYHTTTRQDSTLYLGGSHVLALAPGDLEFLTGEHMRFRNDPASLRVTFERPFVTPPKVVVFFNLIDFDKNYNWRLSITATDIDAKGFTLTIGTWGDTILHAARACWIAYPEDREHIFSASFNTLNYHPLWQQPKSQHSRKLKFGDVEFGKDPTVFVALNSIDIDHSAHLRVDAYVDGISRTGLVWHIDAWCDTILYSAGASIIAFD